MIQKFKKKPVVIEAIQWTGRNAEDIMHFVGKRLNVQIPPHSVEMIVDNLINEDYKIFIPTMEGEMRASRCDFIIKGVNGEFYPCKNDIFFKSYEKVDE